MFYWDRSHNGPYPNRGVYQRGYAPVAPCENGASCPPISFVTRVMSSSVDSDWLQKYLTRVSTISNFEDSSCYVTTMRQWWSWRWRSERIVWWWLLFDGSNSDSLMNYLIFFWPQSKNNMHFVLHLKHGTGYKTSYTYFQKPQCISPLLPFLIITNSTCMSGKSLLTVPFNGNL